MKGATKTKKPTKGQRVRAQLKADPNIRAEALAARVGCNIGYVYAIKKEMAKEAQAKAMAAQPVKVLELKPARGTTAEEEAKWPPLAPPVSGGSNEYYKLRVRDFTVECNDIIEKLGLNYAEGNVFKAVWRRALARNGVGKPGSTPLYESEKIEYFGRRLVEQAKG